ncbi:MAG: DNA polymerase III subunit alpha [Fibrobacteria bacterium]|nr:DNA polymerase III subunit alpha [Fibrobacteria bacterium]
MNYVHLHCHSEFSFHAGTASIPALVTRARTLGYTALALTDTNRVSGLILFYQECIKQGLKPILGVELTTPGEPCEQIVLLARNAEGYADICEIVTQRNLSQKTFSLKTILHREWPNLFILCALPRLLETLSHSPNRERLYGEIINHSKSSRTQSRQVEYCAHKHGIPLVSTNNIFFLKPKHWYIHLVLRAIGLNATISRLKPEEVSNRNAFFRSPKEMQTCFPNHTHALKNSNTIAEACNTELSFGQWIMPKIEVPGEHSPESYLSYLATAGLEKNYGGKACYARAKTLQEKELQVIHKLGYPSYFLMVRQIRNWSSRFKGAHTYRHPSDCSLMRGSAANSITFYNIGASNLDPIKYNLYFERFLNEERAAPPDADLDFGWDERDAVFDFFTKTWGQDRVAVICTTNHFHRRSAFRETAKVFGWTEEQITHFMKKHGSLTKEHFNDPHLQRIQYYASAIQGKPRFLGQHPGGVVVTNQPIWRHVGCQKSGGEKDRVITQIDMHSGTDELGLIKFDILGNGSISVLRDTLAQLEAQGINNPEVHDEDKVQNDPAVLNMIAKGRTRGVFYIESPAQMRLNMKAEARSFEEIGITTSLIRPAGAQYTNIFIERHRSLQAGKQDWQFLHSSLETILHETHDCLVFQEDVIKVCHLVAGMSLKTADRVRKMMNSLQEGVPEDYRKVEQAFVQGCITHSRYTEVQARKLWSRICSFVGFSFCKSHSLSLAQLSFKCAWLKHYYPAQFLAAVISNNRGFYHRSVYLNEARRFGVRIAPIQVNSSVICYTGQNNIITPGLMHIKGLSYRSQKHIIAEREQHGPYTGALDFFTRSSTGKSETQTLIRVGALDSFGLTRPQLMYMLEDWYHKPREQNLLLPGMDTSEAYRIDTDDYNLTIKCLDELQLLGYMLSGDILAILGMHPASKAAIPCQEINHYNTRRIKLFGWPVTSRLHTVPGKGQMKFITIEDGSGCADCVFWPGICRRYAAALLGPGPYEIWGRVQEDWGTFSLVAERIQGVRWSPNQMNFNTAAEHLAKSRNQMYGRGVGWTQQAA